MGNFIHIFMFLKKTSHRYWRDRHLKFEFTPDYFTCIFISCYYISCRKAGPCIFLNIYIYFSCLWYNCLINICNVLFTFNCPTLGNIQQFFCIFEKRLFVLQNLYCSKKMANTYFLFVNPLTFRWHGFNSLELKAEMSFSDQFFYLVTFPLPSLELSNFNQTKSRQILPPQKYTMHKTHWGGESFKFVELKDTS